jgi:hypothetical protein
MKLTLLAMEARERFSELEELLHRPRQKHDAHVCMSGVLKGRPLWQREERLWGIRWLQVLSLPSELGSGF